MKKHPLHYSMLIEWSEEDQAYLVTLPEWADHVVMPVTHGSKMFGMPCLKNSNGKAYAGLFEDSMVFKLGGASHAEALALTGAKLFDPSGRGRPMKEWVVVPIEHVSRWLEFTREAFEYVGRVS